MIAVLRFKANFKFFSNNVFAGKTEQSKQESTISFRKKTA